MDTDKKNYRIAQFKKLDDTEYVEHCPKIKIVKPDGETHWLDITNDELEKIKNILTENGNDETGNNTTYGVVNAHIRKHGIEATRETVFSGNTSHEAVAMTSYIDSRQAREAIREALGGFKEE